MKPYDVRCRLIVTILCSAAYTAAVVTTTLACPNQFGHTLGGSLIASFTALFMALTKRANGYGGYLVELLGMVMGIVPLMILAAHVRAQSMFDPNVNAWIVGSVISYQFAAISILSFTGSYLARRCELSLSPERHEMSVQHRQAGD